MTGRLRVADLGESALADGLESGTLTLRTGPFTCRIRSREPAVRQGIGLMYAAHTVEDAAGFADYHVEIGRPANIRRWLRPQVRFSMDGIVPFEPFPAHQSFALLEWGLNWCIATAAHRWLVLHAAVLARGNDAVVMPAPPGSGKSTLCAALSFRGWRLLSDELALIDPATLEVHGLARPINVKNESIEVVRRYLPEAVVSTPVFDTRKGTIAHIAPPVPAVAAVARPASVRWIMFPQWQHAASLQSTPISQGEALVALIDNAFNYDVHGEQGFLALTAIAQRAAAARLTYSRIDDAIAHFEGIG